MLENDLTISLIIALYNEVESIKRCIESAINQSYKNLEIIIIDDGSTDKSAEICDYYKKLDNRVSVYHKENGGISSARNYGLNKATGDYVCFVDGDDYVEHDMCLKLFETIQKYNNPEIVMFGFNKITEGKTKTKVLKRKNLLQTSITLFDKLCDEHWSVVVWNKAYKRDIIKKHFDENFIVSEDLLFNSQFFVNKHQIAIINQALYNYINKPNSITKKVNRFKIDENISLAKQLYKELNIEYGSLPFVNALILKNIIKNFCLNSKLTTNELVENLKIQFTKEDLKLLLKNTKTKNFFIKILLCLLRHKHYKLFVKLIKFKFK